MPYWIWLILGTALLIVEILAPHLVTVWFALAALLTGVAAYQMHGAAFQLSFFAVSSLILFTFGWFWLRKNLKMGPRHRASLVGEGGTVVSADAAGTGGRVRLQTPVSGEDVWEFESEDRLYVGERCVVLEVTGAKVKVQRG